MALTSGKDTGDAWQNLANAIIVQACTEYRAAGKFLREHPVTPKLEKAVQKRKERRAKLVAKAKAEGEPIKKSTGKKLLPYSDDEMLLAKIRMKTDELKDLEGFFLSEYYMKLTNLDGATLIKRLREEVFGDA